jgi:hypothetical protein
MVYARCWKAAVGTAVLVLCLVAISLAARAFPVDGRITMIARAPSDNVGPADGPSHKNEDDPYGYASVPTYREARDAVPHYDADTRFVSGRITGTTGAYGRQLHVRLDNGDDRTVEAPRNVVVRRNTRPLSVHELRRNEAVRIRLVTYSRTGDLVAQQIDAYEGASLSPRTEAGRQTTVHGSVSSIDSQANILRIDFGRRRLIVHTEHAAIRKAAESIGLRDLQNGDTVVVDGRRDGDEVFALSVVVQ